jgi:signal transduction histidine kinase/ActR/RegA family two-component response regulator
MADTTSSAAAEAAFLRNGGELGRLIAAFDWGRTGAGPIDSWPEAMKSIIAFILRSPLPIVTLWGEDGVMIYNDGYRAFAGARHPALLGSNVLEGWQEVADFNANVLRTVYREGGVLSYKDQELVLVRDGTPKQLWTDLEYSPVVDETGAPIGVLAIVIETTDRVLAERRAAEEQQRQRQLLEQMPGFVGVLSGPEHIYEYANGAYRAIAGQRELIGRSVREAFPELAGQGFYELLDRVRATGERYLAAGLPINLRDEPEPRYIDLLYEPMLNQDGAIVGIFVGGYDATEAYRTLASLTALNETLEERVEKRTRELRDQADFARLALSAVGGVGVWTFDVESDRFFCDESISRLYDIDPEKGAAGISRADFLAHVHPDDRAALRATMADGLTSAGDLELEYRIVHTDGSMHWVLSRGHTYFDEAGRAVRRTGVGVDMTKPRMVEDQLRQAQKMEAVGQLTGGIAHDFNNLLQGVSGSLEMIQRRLAQGRTDELQRFLDGAATAANRAAALTHRLLAFSRRQPLDPKPVQANILIASMEDLLRRTIGEGVEMALMLAGGLWTIRCDPNQLESAILNLAINARDAMPNGGKLIIETANAQIDQTDAARHQGVKPGPYVCVSVTDTGIGMSADTVAKAFEPFFTTKPIGQGTGLGLSMIYGFAQQSEGYAQIYSEVDRGTSVKLYLPRHGEGEAQVEARAAGLGELHVSEAREVVLVVEDEAVVRRLIVEELRELGYAVLEAGDGQEALDRLRAAHRIDLLVTDIGLPILNGRQVADAGRALRPGLKVLFMTGYAGNAALASGFLEPGMELITKPFPMQTLVTRIRAMTKAGG